MIHGFNKTTKKLVIGIIIVLTLLCICMAIDSADTITVNNTAPKVNISHENMTKINGSYYILPKDSGQVKHDEKVYTVKEKDEKKDNRSTITMTGKPSCNKCANRCSYTWRTRTYLNYCPKCHHYNCLGNKHKWAAVHELEISCFHCDADFCVNCGKEKYSWSNAYLIKV